MTAVPLIGRDREKNTITSLLDAVQDDGGCRRQQPLASGPGSAASDG
jgi:hypothetical protein